MAGSDVKNITDENFEVEVLKSDKLVVLDFWAIWCGPCRAISPVIDELATEYAEKVVVGKVNVDEQRGLAKKFKVMSIPTIILFKNGEVVEKVIGMRSREEFQEIIQKNL